MSYTDIFIWELLGTGVLVLIGNGSVAAVVLKNSFSHGGGGDWLVIVLGWGFGVFTGGLNVRDEAYAGLFHAATFRAYMLGSDRVHAVGPRDLYGD